MINIDPPVIGDEDDSEDESDEDEVSPQTLTSLKMTSNLDILKNDLKP